MKTPLRELGVRLIAHFDDTLICSGRFPVTGKTACSSTVTSAATYSEPREVGKETRKSSRFSKFHSGHSVYGNETSPRQDEKDLYGDMKIRED